MPPTPPQDAIFFFVVVKVVAGKRGGGVGTLFFIFLKFKREAGTITSASPPHWWHQTLPALPNRLKDGSTRRPHSLAEKRPPNPRSPNSRVQLVGATIFRIGKLFLG